MDRLLLGNKSENIPVILYVGASSCRDEADLTLVAVEAGPTWPAFSAAATMAAKAG